MKRSAVTTLNDVPPKKAGVIETGVLSLPKIIQRSSILEQGKIYFTPIGGITVPRESSCSEGALSLDEVIKDIQPVSSVHFSYLLDFDYLLSCYPTDLRSNPMKIVVGVNEATDLERITKRYDNVTVVGAPCESFGIHHTKMSMFESADGLVHVIVSTANFVTDDWEFKTQQFYYAVGIKCASEKDTKRSPFQSDLIEYLGQYRYSLLEWRALVSRTDFTEVVDRLVFSTPGKHQAVAAERLGHPRLRLLLSEKFPAKKSTEPSDKCSYIAQCSSIGSLGAVPHQWFTGEFLRSMEGATPSQISPKMWLVFPCVEDVRISCQGYGAGTMIPYKNKIHSKQAWLRRFMCKWRSNKRRRTVAAPHCKTYGKFEDQMPKWQLLTSANLSKAAWGEQRKDGVLYIRSYEMGVLITDPDRFNFPFDYPLVKYADTDQPFTQDRNHMNPDKFGRTWTVSS